MENKPLFLVFMHIDLNISDQVSHLCTEQDVHHSKIHQMKADKEDSKTKETIESDNTENEYFESTGLIIQWHEERMLEK